MKVLVDTPVWSLALRKQPKTEADERVVKELAELVRESRVVLIGPIRQEILSGISDEGKFETLRQKLQAFDDEALTAEHFELAASFSNRCRRQGIQGSHTDFLLCAVSVKGDCPIFTLDKDFDRYREHTGMELHHERDKAR
jgi:predicted nucleic acid-binding protein